MHRTVTIATLYCAVALSIVLSMLMNFMFTFSLAQAWWTGVLIGGVCVAFDAMKACLPVVIPTLYRTGYWLWMCVAALLWLGFFVYAVISAIGVVSEER